MKKCILMLVTAMFFTVSELQGAQTNMDRVLLANEKYETLFSEKRKTHATDPEFMNILQNFIFGEIFYIGDLSDQDRELITVTSLTAIQALPQLKSHIFAALNVGNSPVKIREAIYQCAPFIGFPKTLNAIGVFNEAVRERGIDLPLQEQGMVSEETRHSKGEDIQNRLYGTEVKDAMKTLPPEYQEKIPNVLTDFCFGDFYTRTGLDVKDRELLSLVVLASIGAEKQLSAHIVGNLRAGNSKEKLLVTMIQTIPYIGLPAALTAINQIKAITPENYKPIYE